MQFRSRPRRSVQLDITPLVDGVFLLLIFFAVTTTFSATSGIPLNLPMAEKRAPAREEQQVTVSIDKDGHYYLNDGMVAEGGLKDALLNAVKGDPNRLIVVQADEQAHHGHVVRLLDVASTLGLWRLAIATRPLDDDKK